MATNLKLNVNRKEKGRRKAEEIFTLLSPSKTQ